MKALSFILFLAILVQSHLTAAQTEVPLITAFDGIKTPIRGLFDEPIPEEYFSKNLMEAYLSGQYYRGTFSLAKSNHQSFNDAVSLYNPSDQTIEVVFSCVKLEKAKTKNFIVKIPATQFQQVDITELRGYDQIYILSFLAVEVYFDTNSKDRRNVTMETVEIIPPVKQELDLANKSDCIDRYYPVSVKSNINGTSVTAEARFGCKYDSFFVYYFFDINYPAGNLYHQHVAYWSDETKCGYTKRNIVWHGLYSMLLHNRNEVIDVECVSTSNPADTTCATDNWTLQRIM